MLTVVDALSSPYPCGCDCFHTLTLEERIQGITALYRFDDALRGWGYQPIYELAADVLYRKAQAAADPGYRGITMRDDACVYRRLVGYAVHELIHALEGDPSKANYGIPWGAPYNVPVDLPEGEEAAFIHPHNVGEARAFVGLRPVAVALFGIDWGVYTARDVGTYGFPGGNAIVPAPRGFRQVPHWDAGTTRASTTRAPARSRRPSAATSPTARCATTRRASPRPRRKAASGARPRTRRRTSSRASRRACPGATTPASAAPARSSRSAARRASAPDPRS